MDISFWLKLLSSFIIGSLWVVFTTLIAERFGSKVGGVIGGLPSTVVVALLFIGITQSPMVAAQATTVMPMAQGLNGLFVLTFLFLVSRGLLTSVTGAMLVWFIQSTLLYLLNLRLFWVSLLAWLLLLSLCYLVVEKWMRIPSHSRRQISYPPVQLAWRALFGGTVIALAVLLGKIGGPLLGGIFGSFPAMFLSTLVITYQVGGAGFSRPVGKSMLISGLVNVPLYEMAIRYLYPTMGLALGTLFGVLFSMATGYLTYQYITHKMS